MSDAAAIHLRAATEVDEPFLLAVYASTRAEELAITGWPEEIKAAFCQQQSTAQRSHYRQHYTGAEYLVIEHNGTPVGRLFVERCPNEIRILDIAILPAHRGHGIGTQVLGDLLAEGTATNKPVTIHVEHMNPARRLYDRLGFRLVEDKGIYLFMSCPPDRADSLPA